MSCKARYKTAFITAQSPYTDGVECRSLSLSSIFTRFSLFRSLSPAFSLCFTPSLPLSLSVSPFSILQLCRTLCLASLDPSSTLPHPRIVTDNTGQYLISLILADNLLCERLQAWLTSWYAEFERRRICIDTRLPIAIVENKLGHGGGSKAEEIFEDFSNWNHRFGRC